MSFMKLFYDIMPDRVSFNAGVVMVKEFPSNGATIAAFDDISAKIAEASDIRVLKKGQRIFVGLKEFSRSNEELFEQIAGDYKMQESQTKPSFNSARAIKN